MTNTDEQFTKTLINLLEQSLSEPYKLRRLTFGFTASIPNTFEAK